MKTLMTLVVLLLVGVNAGAQVTIADFHARTEPPVIIYADYGQLVTIKDREFYCFTPDETAIRVIYPDAPSVAVQTVVLESVGVVPGCKRGFHGTNVWNLRANGVTLWGSAAAPMEYGVLLDGRSNDTVWASVHSFYTQTAMRFEGQVESPHVVDSALIATDYGIVVATEQVVPERPGLFVTNTHIAARYRGIVSSWHPQQRIIGNHITQLGTTPGFVGIEIGFRSTDTTLTANEVVCQPNTGGKGLTVHSGAALRTTVSQGQYPFCASGATTVTSAVGVR